MKKLEVGITKLIINEKRIFSDKAKIANEKIGLLGLRMTFCKNIEVSKMKMLFETVMSKWDWGTII